MTASPARHAWWQWHRRLEARVAAALGLIVVCALGATLIVTINSVSRQSRERAGVELEAARTAFYSQMEARTASAIAATQLVTELPVFRAHFIDARLAADRETLDAMADGYRRQLAAQFVVLTSASGEWLASPGWTRTETSGGVPDSLRQAVELARSGVYVSGILERQGDLFLAVSMPAQFGDEVLGTLTAGYPLTDGVAEELARVAHCEVVVMAGGRIAATSLGARTNAMASTLRDLMAAPESGVHDGLYRVGSRDFVAGTFPLQSDEASMAPGRLVLLADWRPTQDFVARLRSRFLTGGALALGFALCVGLVLSRGVSRPLRDIASAAAQVADGDLSLQLPVRGSTEAMTVAHAFNDMSARLRATRERLEYDAIHDGLTELPNRVLFMERLERAMSRRLQHPEYLFAVLFLDLDRFKHVNDSLGHDAGDRLLVAFAERLSGVLRRSDLFVRADSAQLPEAGPNTLARFGGDEFVILLDDIREPFDAVRIAERIQRETAEVFRLVELDVEVFATASIGVAVSSSAHSTGGDLVRDADLALYRAKAAGGGSYSVFDDRMHEEAVERLQIETDLRRAVARGEFQLWYQPITSLEDERVKGFEALIRWNHPERGLLTPAAFLHVAEQVGLMGAIDEWALGEACRQGRAWQLASTEKTPLSVSVNLSSKAFQSASLVAMVEGVLRETGFPASALNLEVTESVAMADPVRARTTLTALRALGVRVSLDDFGTGYCSLSYLQGLPVDTLKIDRSFVSRIGQGEDEAEIVRMIVALAQTLQLRIVAEGTETVEQVEYLRSLGCAFAQGYFFGKPTPAEATSVWPRVKGRAGK